MALSKTPLLALGAVATVAAAALGSAVAAEAAKAPYTIWEYHCVLPPGAIKSPEPKAPPTPHELAYHSDTGEHPSEKVLNHLGSQGWELVAIDPGNHHYCFKRPMP